MRGRGVALLVGMKAGQAKAEQQVAAQQQAKQAQQQAYEKGAQDAQKQAQQAAAPAPPCHLRHHPNCPPQVETSPHSFRALLTYALRAY